MKIKHFFSVIFRFRYLIGIFCFAIAVGFSLHFSSISMWDYYVPGDEQQKDINLFGKGRPIRSDEWISGSIIILAQAKNQKFYPLINDNIGSGMNMFLVGAPVFDLSMVGRPQNWGFFLLGAERGFSWLWCFRLLLLFFTSFELILYLTNNSKGYALTGAVLIVFSPLVQWWLAESFINLIMFFQLILVCLIAYFKVHESILKRIFCLAGMAIGLCGFAFSFFPAVTLPLLLLLLVLIGLILWKNWKYINKIDWLMAGCCVAFVILVISYAFLRSWDDIQNTLNIKQANRFFLPGRYDIRHQMYEYFSIALPFKDITFNNNCEVSRFITLMPLTLFLFPLLLSKMKPAKNDMILQMMVYGLLLILCVWAYIPMPSSVGKLFSQLTLLFSTNRVHILIGLFGIYLFVIVLWLRGKVKFTVYEKLLLCLIAICSILYALYTQQVKEYLGAYITVISLFFIGVSLFLILGKPKWCMVILSLCVLGAGVSVNPVAHGLDPIYNKPISREIEEIQKSDPQARWIVMTGLHHSYLPALGINCFNTVQFTPFSDQWKLFDPNGKYTDIYNRYCFVRTAFTQEESFFEVVHGDLIDLHLNLKDLPLTKADYIYTDRELIQWSTEDTFFQQIYLDPYSGYRIYHITGNRMVNRGIIYEIPLSDDIEILKQNANDIDSIDLISDTIVLKCGTYDPYLYISFQNAIEKPIGIQLVEIIYTNSQSGRLQIFYDYGDGLNEERSTAQTITASNIETTIQMGIAGWRQGSRFVGFRIDPPDNTEFVIKSIKILSYE